MRLILCIILFFAFLNPSWAAFMKVDGIEKASLYKVYVSGLDDNLVYAASSNTLFKSQDKGKSWQKIFVTKDEVIKDLFVDEYLYDKVYLASQSFLYRITREGVEKIFTLPPEVENICVRKSQGIIYLGTTEGIYYSTEDFLRWKKLDGLPQDLAVYSIDFSSKNIYVASNLGVYVSGDNKRFERRFVLKAVDTEEEEEYSLVSRILKVDTYQDNIVYLGTSKGIFVSYDSGSIWSKVHISVVENSDIRSICQTILEKNNLYLATDRGAFRVNPKEEEYQTLFEGLPTNQIYWLDFDRTGRLFVATDRGLFLKEQFNPSASSSKLEELVKKEPSIEDVQQVALRYNEVHPEKIKRWRKNLKYRALFPDVNIDYDKTVTYDSGSDRYYTGPYDWGVSLSWDLGDLIWNSYEDDVDTRSRLITQLRINILDDINTIYHERLRVKQELMSKSFKDESERFKKELRLRELTSALDGYTGGYFSKRLRQIQKE